MKNIRGFFGHPMIAYTIAAARNCEVFDRILVSSDDPLIGRVAEWYGAEFLPRPAELASDSAGLVEVALHALDTIGAPIDILCQLMPNCPLRRSQDIADHYHQFRDGDRRFQISVVRYRGVYPHWALGMDAGGRGKWLFDGDFNQVLSQELPTALCPTGAIWWAQAREFQDQKAFYGDPFHLAEIEANRGMDIDNEEDLALAEVLVSGLRQRSGESPLEPVEQPGFPEGSHRS